MADFELSSGRPALTPVAELDLLLLRCDTDTMDASTDTDARAPRHATHIHTGTQTHTLTHTGKHASIANTQTDQDKRSNMHTQLQANANMDHINFSVKLNSAFSSCQQHCYFFVDVVSCLAFFWMLDATPGKLLDHIILYRSRRIRRKCVIQFGTVGIGQTLASCQKVST